MTVLLDLPNEILEVVLRTVVREIGPCMSSQPSCYSSGIESLRIALPLRLVCSTFRNLADPYIFENIACLITSREDARDSGPVKRGIIELLGANSSIGGSVKKISFEGEHMEGTEKSPQIVERLAKVMRYAHRKLERMSWERYDGYEAIPIPFYTGIFTQGFPNLRKLLLGDIAFAFCFPEIAATAPLLEYVQLSGSSDLSYDDVERLVADMTLPSILRGTASNPIDTLRLLRFGGEWLNCLLNHVRPYAKHVILDSDRYLWQAPDDQMVRALKHLGNGQGFESFTIAHWDIEDDWLVGEEATEVIYEFMEESIPQRTRLFNQLKEEWAGKGVTMGMLEPCYDWHLFAQNEGMTIGRLLEDVWAKL